jgi:hypothetical protein
MPNWCTNYLTITSTDKAMMDKIRKGVYNDKGLFALFYPIPEELNYEVSHPPTKTEEEIQALTEKYGAGDWYSWSIKNWGCKWDARDFDIYEDNNEDFLSLRFDTPWGPPIDFYRTFAEDYKVTISADYREEGMEFCGKFETLVKDGEVYISEDYRNTDEIREDILFRYLEINKNIEVTSEDFTNALRSLYVKIYPEVDNYYDSYEIFDDYWVENQMEDDEFCKQYGIINKTTN